MPLSIPMQHLKAFVQVDVLAVLEDLSNSQHLQFLVLAKSQHVGRVPEQEVAAVILESRLMTLK